MTADNGISRRAALAKLGLFLNGIVGIALAVPIVRYLLSPVTRGKKINYESWLSLGGLEQFPSGQTRLATYKNPVTNAWDGETSGPEC
jgi:menaquinol-cytochrome c reductase iron-sulfur subunit